MDYQRRVKDWMLACFPIEAAEDTGERTHRFLEEALELAQANSCTKAEVLALVDYVFSRQPGATDLEVGGVMVTLAGVCNASGVDMMTAGEDELSRNWNRIDAIRAKRAARPPNSPLPQ